jgi:hypothetical protein
VDSGRDAQRGADAGEQIEELLALLGVQVGADKPFVLGRDGECALEDPAAV